MYVVQILFENGMEVNTMGTMLQPPSTSIATFQEAVNFGDEPWRYCYLKTELNNVDGGW